MDVGVVAKPQAWWGLSMYRMLCAGSVLIGLCAGLEVRAADAPEVSMLLKTFVDELLPITPGTDRFPAELVVPFSGDVVDGQAKTFKLDRPFAIAKYEVPQDLWTAVMGSNPSKWSGPGRERNSAEMMTWTEARTFCSKLTKALRDARLIEADEEIRLPTEVEWEYCARAGTDTAYSFGDRAQAEGDAGKTATILDGFGWHTGNASGNDPPVGALKPNPWGLYDVHGYLWEFCSDPWSAEVTGGKGETEGAVERVAIRGGSWKDRYEELTSASRRDFAVDGRDDAVGLRCVRARVQ